MRISDWSSDVCSSDLKVRRLPLPRGETDIFHDRLCDDQIVDSPEPVLRLGHPLAEPLGVQRVLVGIERRQKIRRVAHLLQFDPQPVKGRRIEIGRASCRESVCQYVSLSVVAVSLKKTKANNTHNTP